MPANILVPEMGESIVDARVARWLKEEGQPVAAGEALVELETDKIDVEVSAPEAGVLSKITRGPGEDVKIGDVIGVIDAQGQRPAGQPTESQPHVAGPQAGARSAPAAAQPKPAPRPAAPSPVPEASATSAPAAQERTAGPEKTRSTPTARRVADEHDINLEGVRGSGEAGRVTRKDVEGLIARQPAPEEPLSAPAAQAPAAPARARVPARPPVPEGERREERVRMSKRRATIARRLVEAQHAAAMLTTFNEVDMSAIMALRERRKQSFKDRYGVSLGIASFFVKASVGALREFPRINAEIDGDEMVLKHYYDIGVAVGAAEGLVVPVLRDADRMSFAEIEQKIREYAKKANDGTLTLADLRGGTFTITNGGVFGSLVSTPIINPPQVGILGLHKIQERPVAIGGRVEVRPMMYVALTYDHRIVDGAEAVRFLVRMKELAEDPGTLLLEM
jgi:2-oxoglutarate dehydrogenase E2 component (dihydrolipoamide succinyltransferase)